MREMGGGGGPIREVRYVVTRDAFGNAVVQEVRAEAIEMGADGTVTKTVREEEQFLACGCPHATSARVRCHVPTCVAVSCGAHQRVCVRCGFGFCGAHAIGGPETIGAAPWCCGDCYRWVFPVPLWWRVARFVWGA